MKTLLAFAFVLCAANASADDRPPGGHRGPPPEAVDACKSKAAGDACQFTHHDRAHEGTCFAGPRGDGALACKPKGPPPKQ